MHTLVDHCTSPGCTWMKCTYQRCKVQINAKGVRRYPVVGLPEDPEPAPGCD